MEALEEPSLKGKIFPVRGRLGGLELAPSLEDMLLEIEPGGNPVIEEIRFPLWWPDLSRQKRIVRLHLVDSKPNYFPPILDQFMESEDGN